MEQFMAINEAINGFVWGPIMLVLLIGTGLYLSIRSGFIQFRYLGYAMKHTIGGLFGGNQRTSEGENISPFQAVATALASTVGTGNIVGVATAIATGGPGAVFWMWISALLGMMTKFSEVTLAVKYRETGTDGQYRGGPMYYMKNGVGAKYPGLGKVLAVFFSIFAAFACFGIGNMTQSNSIASTLNTTFHVPTSITGIVLCVIVAAVVLGGLKNISRVTEMLVPFMAVFYVVFGLIIVLVHAKEIGPVFADIFAGAFNPSSVLGGGAGVTIMMAVRMGMARGVFSNEAGLGSAPIVHAATSEKVPVKQGLWGIMEVFIDTIVICTLTSLIILTAVYPAGDPNAGTFVWRAGHLNGADLTLKAFELGLPGQIGSVFLTIGLFCFAFSTLLGWNYYGEKSWEYLFRNNESVRKAVILIYRIAYIVAVYVGCTGGLQFVWGLADTLNGAMAIPNLIAILILSPIVIKESKEFFAKVQADKKAGKK